MSKITKITTPDFSRHVIAVETLVRSKRRPRVRKVTSVKHIPILTKEQREKRKAIDLHG